MPTSFCSIPLSFGLFFSLFLSSLSWSIHQPLTQPSLIPPFLQSISYTVFSRNKKKHNCGRIPPVQVRVMCCDERTWRQRGLLIMKHTGPSLPHRERGDAGKEKWPTGEPAEHHMREEEFRRHTEGDVWGWNWNFRDNRRGRECTGRESENHLFCLALHYYLLEPEGEPAIVPERECEKEEEMRICLFMHTICLKTSLCLIHPTQVEERS